jgi:hypothetical protein
MIRVNQLYAMSGIFVWAVTFALGLHKAVRRYGPVLDDWTWLIVAIGCGPVTLWLLLLYPLEQWIYIPAGFFIACMPVAGCSLYRAWEKYRKHMERS